MERDWKNLPKHLLDSVVEKLLLSSDYMAFSVVCKSWYSVAKDNKSKRARLIAPMILIYSGKKDYWNLYDVIRNKVLDMQVRVPRTRLCGSSKGWLIYVHRNVEEKTFGVTLVNPFLRVKGRKTKENSIIRLPLLTPLGWERRYEDCEGYVIKATISADPIENANECIVTVIHLERCDIAFIRLGKDTTWTYVDESVDAALIGCQMIEEVANVGTKFYAVNYRSELVSFDITSESYSVAKLVGRGIPLDPNFYMRRYIFEGAKKELLMVQRYMELEEHEKWTKKFRVFELDIQRGEWIEKNTLDDHALFVGDNSTICVPSNISGIGSNCIYFNHDFDHLYRNYEAYDYDVYNVEDQILSQPYSEHAENLMARSRPLPIWVVPTLIFSL